VVHQEARLEVSAIDRSEAGLGGAKEDSPSQTRSWWKPPSQSRHGYCDPPEAQEDPLVQTTAGAGFHGEGLSYELDGLLRHSRPVSRD
jgi:hypothetical protein